MSNSPMFCKGAVEGIIFLLTTYGDKLEKYELGVLKDVLNKYLDYLNNLLYIKEDKKISYIYRYEGKKRIITTYGKMYVSRIIESDEKYLEETNKIDLILNSCDFNNKVFDSNYELGKIDAVRDIYKLMESYYNDLDLLGVNSENNDIRLKRKCIKLLVLKFLEMNEKDITIDMLDTFLPDVINNEFDKDSDNYLQGKIDNLDNLMAEYEMFLPEMIISEIKEQILELKSYKKNQTIEKVYTKYFSKL